MLCNVCQKDRTCSHSFELTAEEQTTLGCGPATLYYCDPCWRIINDREKCASLLRGVYQETLTRLGHHDPERAGSKLQAFLLDKSKGIKK